MTGPLVTLGETLASAYSPWTGSLAHIHSLQLSIGGAESNVAIGVRRLGHDATWIGRVGDDPLGERVLRELRAEGLDVRATIDGGAPTALMLKERRTPDATRIWYYRRDSAGSHLGPQDLPDSAVAAAGMLHVTGITPGLSESADDAVTTAVDQARRAGVPVSFDLNHRSSVWGARDPVTTYARLAGQADLVFASEDEARLVTATDLESPDELARALADSTPGTAVLKLGPAGCLAATSGEVVSVPAVRVTVVDTVGAGDAFVAGFLAERLAGRPLDASLATAVACGALACTAAGDWEGLPTRRDLSLLTSSDPVLR